MFIRYTVKPGDTLSAIAKEFLGDGNRLNEILDEALTEQERFMENAKG